MQDFFYTATTGLLGIQTNVKNFKWSFGINMPLASREEYEACVVRLNLEVGKTQISLDEKNLGKYHYFNGIPDGDEIYYQRPFMFNKHLEFEAKGLLSDSPYIKVNNTYYRFVRHRFMNVHSIGYILTDLAALLLLRHGYAPLHCSAFRKGNSTVVIFAPPNTGKTLSAMMACMEHKAEFLAEDLAITDGNTVYSVPWTSTFRYYAGVERGFFTRALNNLTKIFPPLELLPIIEPKSINAYIDREGFCDKSQITHLFILERGVTSVKQVSPKEACRKITNLNRYEFNYIKAPLLVAHEFFNPCLNLTAAYDAEHDILKKLVDNANERFVICADNPMDYVSLIMTALK